jgi:hypothetical protein
VSIRRRYIGIALSVILGLGVAISITSPASAATFGPYYISVPGYNYCLDVVGVSYSNGAPLQIYDCIPNQWNQQFYLRESPDGFPSYQIVARHSGKCLDVTGVSQDNWAGIQQFDCLGQNQTNQIFYKINPTGTNYTRFMALHSSRCIDYEIPIYQQAGVFQYNCGTYGGIGSSNFYLTLA